MTTKDFLIDNCSDGQAVEAVCKRLPQLYIESSLACKTQTQCNKYTGFNTALYTEEEKTNNNNKKTC
jgi:hypothetical protein